MKKVDLNKVSRTELLRMKLSDLNLLIKGSWVEECIDQLYKELRDKGLSFRPHIWISDDWFCPDGVPGFAIPFYLLHPRLIELEKEASGEVEGATKRWCMKLLRHETGHAIDNAYKLKSDPKRENIFGDSTLPYPKSYVPLPYSKKFVRHLRNGYAQSHPVEDWAETFAIWLTPKSSWKKSYANWPALKKLRFIDKKMNEIKGHSPTLKNKRRVDKLALLHKDLGSHFKARKRHWKKNQPSLFEKDLSTQFLKRNQKYLLSSFIRSQRRELMAEIAKKTHLRHYRVNLIINELIQVSNERNMTCALGPVKIRRELVKVVAKKSSRFLKEGKHRIIM